MGRRERMVRRKMQLLVMHGMRRHGEGMSISFKGVFTGRMLGVPSIQYCASRVFLHLLYLQVVAH